MTYYRLVSFTGTCWEFQQWKLGVWETIKTFPYLRGFEQALDYYNRKLWRGELKYEDTTLLWATSDFEWFHTVVEKGK